MTIKENSSNISPSYILTVDEEVMGKYVYATSRRLAVTDCPVCYIDDVP